MSILARSAVSLAASAVTALTFGLLPASASAVDFDGYLRTGPGGTSTNAARACYDLGISGGHYRLGNECDFYGEFGLAQTGTTEGGATWKAKVMFNEYNHGTDIGSGKNDGSPASSFEQMYVEGKNFVPGTNFWIGKRFYGRKDVHILDTFFVRMDGVGAGADQIELGGGAKLGVAAFTSDTGSGFGDAGNSNSTNPGARLNVDVTEIPVGFGALRVTGTYTKGRFDNATNGKGTSGIGVSLQHTVDIAAVGGGNTLWLQFANGSAGLDGNFGSMTAETSVKKWRLVESLAWQLGDFGGQAVALYGQHNQEGTTPKFSEASIGGRASFALTKNFKLVGELGYMQKKPDGSEAQKLTKFTFAPTLSAGPGFWNRPELRLYVTTAKWNDAANAGAGTNGLTGLNNGKTKGTSIGAQAEIWF